MKLEKLYEEVDELRKKYISYAKYINGKKISDRLILGTMVVSLDPNKYTVIIFIRPVGDAEHTYDTQTKLKDIGRKYFKFDYLSMMLYPVKDEEEQLRTLQSYLQNIKDGVIFHT